MCQKMTKSQLVNLFGRFFRHDQDQLAQLKLKQQLCRYPKETFSLLLIEYFGKDGEVNAYSLERKLFPMANELYIGVMIFLSELETIHLFFQQAKQEADFTEKLSYLRRFCRAILLTALEGQDIPNTGKKRIQQALAKMLSTDKITHQMQFEKNLPFNSQEVICGLTFYLKDADILADLPQFVPVYFTRNELAPINSDLSDWNLNQFSLRYLKNLLSSRKQQQISQVLTSIIFDDQIALQAKQAYAIYISLSQSNWIDHPFIRRFIAVSYLEGKVAEIEANFKVSHLK